MMAHDDMIAGVDKESDRKGANTARSPQDMYRGLSSRVAIPRPDSEP